MKYLTFLDYTALESRGKNIEVKLLEKDSEIQALRSKEEIKGQFQLYEEKMAEFAHDIQVRLKAEETSSSTDRLVMEKMREILDRVAPDWYQEVFGPKASRLTPKAQEKVNEMLKLLTSQIDAEDRQRDLELQKQRKVLVDSMGQG